MELCLSGTELSCRPCGIHLVITPSPVPHLYRSLLAPTELEISEIRDYISGVEHLLQPLDGTQTLCEHIEDKVSGTRKKMQRTLAIHKAFLAPWQRLPNEIITEIFWICCNLNYWTFPCKGAPTVLTHICSSWRTMVLEAPKLWSLITLEEMGLPKLSILKDWLRRSGTAPLSVSIDIDDNECPHLPMLIQALAEESKRWKSLSISGDGPYAMSNLQSIKGRLPWLESLCIGDCGYPKEPVDYFLDAPSLRRVHIKDTSPQDLVMPTDRLTHISATFENVTLFVEALQFSPLVYLQAYDVMYYGDEFEDRSSIPCELDWLAHLSFLAFLRRSLHSLKVLELSYFPRSQEILGKGHVFNFTDYLRATPSLTALKLRLVDGWITDQVMVDLTISNFSESRSSTMVPMLEELEFANQSSNFDLFADMIGSRCSLVDTETCRRLRTVGVWLNSLSRSEFEKWWLDRFEGYRQQGLELSINGMVAGRKQKIL